MRKNQVKPQRGWLTRIGDRVKEEASIKFLHWIDDSPLMCLSYFPSSRNSLPTVCYSRLVEMSCLPPVSFSGLPTELISYCFLLLSHWPHHSPPAFSFWGSVSCSTLKGQWKHAPAGAVLYHDLSPLGVLFKRTNKKAKQKDTCWWFVTQLAQISLISCLCCSLSLLVSNPPFVFLSYFSLLPFLLSCFCVPPL